MRNASTSNLLSLLTNVKGSTSRDLLSGENFRVQVGELARRAAASLDVELSHVARRRERIGERAVFAHGKSADAAGLFHHVFWRAAGDGQAHQMIASTLLNREINGAAVGRPLRRALAIVDHAANFVAIAAVSVHHPDVRVFHGRFAVG